MGAPPPHPCWLIISFFMFLQMVQGAKDGSLAKHMKSSGEECLPVCAIGPVITAIAIAAEKAGDSGCFSSSSTVQTPNGVIAIKNLRLNDLVLTFTPGLGAHYTEVDSHAVSYQNKNLS